MLLDYIDGIASTALVFFKSPSNNLYNAAIVGGIHGLLHHYACANEEDLLKDNIDGLAITAAIYYLTNDAKLTGLVFSTHYALHHYIACPAIEAKKNKSTTITTIEPVNNKPPHIPSLSLGSGFL